MLEHIFWILTNLAFIAWWIPSPSSTTKGVVIALLTAAMLINLIALYGSLHTL